MPILKKKDVKNAPLSPGVDRWEIVNGELGSSSLTVGDLTVNPGSTVPTHVHPTEEAMVILEGELETVLGDANVTVTAGQTVLAPAGVKHGFMNRGSSSARLLAIFPTDKVERTFVD